MPEPVNGHWLLVIPPEGAARQVGQNLWQAMESILPADRRRCFETGIHLRAFDGWLKNPNDDLAVDLMGQSLIVQALDFAATHVMVVALAPVTFFAVNLLKRQGIKTLHWFVEDYRQAPYWKKVLAAYTHWIAIQRGPVADACQAAGIRYAYLPTATAMVFEGPIKPWDERRYDVAFVGIPSEYRVRVLEAVAASGISMAIAGAGWEHYQGPLRPHILPGGWMDSAQSFAILLEARIGLHVSHENPEADRGNAHVSPRIFEVLASGGRLLCEDIPANREALRGFSVDYFHGPNDVVEALRKCRQLPLTVGAQSDQQRGIGEQHTYRQRFLSLAALAN